MNFPNGIFELSAWGYALVAFVYTHITLSGVTIYLHRAQAHRSLELGPVLSHLYREILWMSTGMVTKEWVAIHRKHHGQCEMDDDPHSPIIWLAAQGAVHPLYRLLKMAEFIFWRGVRLYVAESRKKETLERYGVGTPNDWMEKNIYSRFPKSGVVLMLMLNLLCFGLLPGFLIWVTQMVCIPILAAGVINGIGHFLGYRNFDSAHRVTGVKDSSRNILPWGIFIAGEELHNNHHGNELSPKLSVKWYEFDVGWLYIKVFHFFGLVKSIRHHS